MPIIFCSTKLSRLAGLKTRLPSISMDNWNGHLFHLEGRKCLVFVHKETFYSFVVFDVLKKQLSDFRQIFIDNLMEQLQNDGLLSEELKHFIIKDYQDFQISTTDGDKSTIGFMNDCIGRLTWEVDGRPPTIEKMKHYVFHYYNANPLTSRKWTTTTEKWTTPKELMREKLKNYVEY